MADVIEIARQPNEYYLPCKCGGKLWGIVMQENTIIRLSCANCETVYDFTAEEIEFELE